MRIADATPPVGPGPLDALNRRLEARSPTEVLAWAWDELGPEAAASSSFQTQSVPLLHMISRVVAAMPVLFLDTGFHFPETLAFRDRLVRQLGLKLEVLRASGGARGVGLRYGELYRTDPDLCCHLNKVEPMERIQRRLRGWITGIRRDQTVGRRGVEIVSRLPNGVIKVCPLAGWTAVDVEAYLARHRLPRHPLEGQGFASIGCAPCTRPVRIGENARAGRWAGHEKTECGLHTLRPAPDGAEEERE